MKRPALQNKQVAVLRMAFRARKVLGTFEKRAPAPNKNVTFTNFKRKFGEIVLEWFPLKHEHRAYQSCCQGDINLALDNNECDFRNRSGCVHSKRARPKVMCIRSRLVCVSIINVTQLLITKIVRDKSENVPGHTSGKIGQSVMLYCAWPLRAKIWPFTFPCSFFFF